MAPTDTARGHNQPLSTFGLLLLSAITLFWGTNWPFMKIVLSELSVLWFRTFCLTGGGIGLMLIATATGTSLRIPARRIPHLLLCAALNILAWHLFSAYGLQLIPAGRAATIAFTMPVWTALFSSLFLGEPMTRFKIVGLILGLCGLAVLIGPDLVVFRTAPVGAMFMIGAAISWAAGTVAFKRFDPSVPVISALAWQFLAAAVPVTLAALVFEPVPDFGALSTEAYLSFAYVLGLPILFCQWAYLKAVRIFPASVAAIGTLAIPVVSVYSAALILGEPIGIQEISALLLICSAMACVLLLPTLRQRAVGPT